VTSIKKRLENVVEELLVIHEALKNSSRYPPCCLVIHENGKISCDILGPLNEEDFLRECRKCQEEIKKFLSNLTNIFEERKMGS
jgi:hypothetical protein